MDPMAYKPFTMVTLDDIGQVTTYTFTEFDGVKGKKTLITSGSPTMIEVADTFFRGYWV